MTFLKTLILLTGLVFISSVSVIGNKDPLLSLLTPEERLVHQCLETKAVSECLKGTTYEGRSPSSEKESLIQRLDWFFSAKDKRFNFIKFMDSLGKIKKSLKSVNGFGVGVLGEAYFGFGKSWMAEIVRHDGKLGLFCAPGINARTDLGIGVGLTAVRTLSCRDNHHYKGNFLSLAAGVSGEFIGLPIGLGMSYSFGVDLYKLRKQIQLADLNERELQYELKKLSSFKELFKDKTPENENLSNLIYYGATLVEIINPNLRFDRPKSAIGEKAFLRSISRGQSLGIQFKNFIHSRKLQDFFQDNNLSNLGSFFTILAGSFTGCDSLGGVGSLSLSLSPVTLGVAYNHYGLLFEPKNEEIDRLDRFSPLMLLNPVLLSTTELRFIKNYAKDILDIPGRVRSECGVRKSLRP